MLWLQCAVDGVFENLFVPSGTQMPCYTPLQAYRSRRDGSVIFVERGDCDSLQLPCGQCIGCRLERSRVWAVRIMHEAQLYRENQFLTLTYDDAHLPEHGQLVYKHFQDFLKRYRKHVAPSKIRFFAAGEYGDTTKRPHYHACIFNHFFSDAKPVRQLTPTHKYYTSEALTKLWGKGNCTIGLLTFESAAYVARYCLKKVTGKPAKDHYLNLDQLTGELVQMEPEHCRMSLKPGIGTGWYNNYKSDIYPSDEVIMNGKTMSVPRYYDKRYQKESAIEMEALKFARDQKSRANYLDNTPERLAVKEQVTQARSDLNKRKLS